MGYPRIAHTMVSQITASVQGFAVHQAPPSREDTTREQQVADDTTMSRPTWQRRICSRQYGACAIGEQRSGTQVRGSPVRSNIRQTAAATLGASISPPSMAGVGSMCSIKIGGLHLCTLARGATSDAGGVSMPLT
jgi:hypothetical protein